MNNLILKQYPRSYTANSLRAKSVELLAQAPGIMTTIRWTLNKYLLNNWVMTEEVRVEEESQNLASGSE